MCDDRLRLAALRRALQVVTPEGAPLLGAPPMKMARLEATAGGEDAASAPGPSARAVTRPHMVPLGPKTGAHWVGVCPTRGDPSASAEEANTEVVTADSASDVATVTAPLPDDDVAPPPAESANVAGEAEGEKESARFIATEAGLSMAAKTYLLLLAPRCHGAGPQAAPGGRAREPALYERLTEEDRVNEMGLLLQAFRFMVSRDFFEA